MLSTFAVDVLRRSGSVRSDPEKDLIYQWVVQNFEMFSGISKEIVDDIVSNSNLRECENNSLVIKQGELGSSFFLIIEGRVTVYVNTEAVTDVIEEQNRASSAHRDNLKRENIETFDVVSDKSKYGNFIGYIEAGNGFGELALISDDVRHATIIADDKCLFLVLDKAVYNRSLRLHQEVEYQTFIDFVNRSPIFYNWQPRYKKQVAMSLKRVTFPFDGEIVKQGDKINGIGFIVEGQAKIVMDITMHCLQYPSFELSDKLLTTGTNGSLQKSLSKVKNLKHLEIALVGPGEIIGDIELSRGLETSCRTVIPIEPTEVYFLNERNYERLVLSKKNQITAEILRSWADQRLLSQYARPSYREIPLIDHIAKLILQEKIKAQEQVSDRKIKNLSANKAPEFISRGPLIDMFGPGTVFHRNRRLRKKKKKDSRRDSEGANTSGLSAADQGKYQIPGLEKAPTFLDVETSTKRLDLLETKILSWYGVDAEIKPEKVNIPKLQGFVKKDSDIVKPGKTIILKPRQLHTLEDLVIKTSDISVPEQKDATLQLEQANT